MSGDPRVPALIAARRSRRAFAPDPVERSLLDDLVHAACLAPAPHHSRPWTFAIVDTPAGRAALAEGMARRWRADLAGDGAAAERIEDLTAASIRKITGAPAAILACLTGDGLDTYPDEGRRRAEWGMATMSLGAAVQNLLLAATERGLASCWVAAPIFCPEEARDALDLPAGWLPRALVLCGRPAPGAAPPARPPVPLDRLRAFR